MMKRLALFFLLLIFVSAAFGQNWFKGTFNDALGKAKNEGKMVLINFFSDG
jgi:hypothetical protein